MGIIKNYYDKKWTLQFLDVLYNSIDYQCAHMTISFVLYNNYNNYIINNKSNKCNI
jgi:hypothetical protein